jgi:predicted permease
VRDLSLGYDVDRLLWVGVEERGERLTPAEGSALRDRLAEAARAVPRVAQASRARTVPFWMTWDQSIFVAGHDTAALNAMGQFRIQAAAPEHLATMGTRLLRGRWIERGDVRGAPAVMVVSDSMAKALWPREDALGKCVHVGADTAPCTTVVGVAENVRSTDFTDDNLLYYYMPVAQVAAASGGLFVRASGKAPRAAEAVRSALQSEMPGASYVTVRPMSEIFAPTVRSWRLGATMFVAFGCLALALAAIGLYSVIAYNVSQRTQEMGVRVAFGAQIADVMRLVLRDGLRLSIVGVAIGAGVALLAGRWVSPLLFRVNPVDPAVFVIAGATLLLAAMLATLIPAVRAARVDPSVALKSE